MKRSLDEYLRLIRARKKQRRRFVSAMTAMSVVVSCGVFWQLRGTGTAVTDYAAPEDMLSDLQSLSLSESELEAGIPELTADIGENVALIAESQLGYKEELTSLTSDGTALRYSRYGAWYGNPSGDWNTMFTLFCIGYSGVPPEEIPSAAGCWAWEVKLCKQDLISSLSSREPMRGDILLLDTDSDGLSDRSCIVVETGEVLNVIEGDVDGEVAEQSYPADDNRIIGYVPVNHIFPDPDKPPDEDAPSEAEENDEAPDELTEFSSASESGISVLAYAGKDAFPPETVMEVTDIPAESAQETAEDFLGEAQMLSAVAVDISFYSPDGEELEPSEGSAVSVTIELPEEMPEGVYSLLHVTDDGVDAVENAVITSDTAEFISNSFSMYIWTTSRSEEDTDKNAHFIDIGTIGMGNSIDNPYVVNVGDVIYLRANGKKSDFFYESDQQYHGFSTIKNNLALTGVVSRHPKKKNDWFEDYTVEDEIYTYDYACYLAQSTGIVGLAAKGAGNTIYIKIEEPLIYVETALGEIEKNRVHEYLETGIHNNDNRNQYIYTVDSSGNILPAYVCNNGSDEGKYMLLPDETVTLTAYVPKGETPDFTIPSGLEIVDGTKKTESLSDGRTKITATFRAKIETGNLTVRIGDVDDVAHTFYIWVRRADDYRNPQSTHADIEISDGGTYSIVKVKDGVRTVYTYDAVVSNVNHCYIKDAADNIIMTYLPEDYTPFGTLGVTQYELSSQVICQNEPTKWFDRAQADHAEFDVQLYLKPVSKTVDGVSVALSGDEKQPKVLESAIFNMNNRALLDAYNKCPDHSGLDFTLKANLNELVSEVTVSAEKVLNNAQLSTNQFEFELVRCRYRAVKYQDLADIRQNRNVADLFGSVKSDCEYDAVMMMNFQNYTWQNCYDRDAFINEMKSYRSDYDSEWAIGSLIDRLNGTAGAVLQDTDTIRDLDTLYVILTRHFKLDETVYAANGVYDIEPGFYLFSEKKVVATAFSTTDGKIVFPEETFTDTGDYFYIIREKIPSDNNAYVFDEHTEPLRVTVTKEADGNLKAETSYGSANPRFTNTLKIYSLPSTGGIGIFPFIAGGGIMISAAFTLFAIRRRKEDRKSSA